MRTALPTLPYLPPWYRRRDGRRQGRARARPAHRLPRRAGGRPARSRAASPARRDTDGRRDRPRARRAGPAGGRERARRARRPRRARSKGRRSTPTSRVLSSGPAQLLAVAPPGRPVARRRRSRLVRGCSVGVVGRRLRPEWRRPGSSGSSGVEVERADRPATGVDLTVCAPSAERAAAAAGVERAGARRPRTPWLQVLPFDGRYAAVGPLYLPGRHRAATSASACGVPRTSMRPRSCRCSRTAPAAYPSSPAVDAAASAAIAAQLALGWLVLGDHYAPAAFYALELLPTIALTVASRPPGPPLPRPARASPTSRRRCPGTRRSPLAGRS